MQQSSFAKSVPCLTHNTMTLAQLLRTLICGVGETFFSYSGQRSERTKAAIERRPGRQ